MNPDFFILESPQIVEVLSSATDDKDVESCAKEAIDDDLELLGKSLLCFRNFSFKL